MSYALNYVEVELGCLHEEAQVPVDDIIIKEISDIIVHGKIFDCDHKPVKCAIVKVFYIDEHGKEIGYAHTFTACDGEYMLNLPYDIFNGKKIKIKATKTNKPSSCECKK